MDKFEREAGRTTWMGGVGGEAEADRTRQMCFVGEEETRRTNLVEVGDADRTSWMSLVTKEDVD